MPRRKKKEKAAMEDGDPREEEKAAQMFAQGLMGASSTPPPPQVDPVQQVAADQKKLNRRQQDLELWHKWDQGGRKPEDLAPLLQHFEGMKQQQLRTKKFGPQVQPDALAAEVDKRMIQRLETFNPQYGTALSTHVFPGIRSSSRWGNIHANTRALPEADMQQISPLQAARDELHEQFGRPPTHEEIAAHAKMPLKRVNKILTSADQRDVLQSSFEADPTPRAQPRDVEIRDPFYRTLEGPEREVFAHWYGLDGRPQIRSGKQLAKKLGKSESEISHMRTRIFNKYKSYL